VINKEAILLMRETGRGNRVAVLSRDKTDVSRGGGINDRGKNVRLCLVGSFISFIDSCQSFLLNMTYIIWKSSVQRHWTCSAWSPIQRCFSIG